MAVRRIAGLTLVGLIASTGCKGCKESEVPTFHDITGTGISLHPYDDSKIVDDNGTRFYANRVDVQFNDSVSEKDISKIAKDFSAEIVAYNKPLNVYSFLVPDQTAGSMQDLITSFGSRAEISFAEAVFATTLDDNSDLERLDSTVEGERDWAYQDIDLYDAYALIEERGNGIDNLSKVIIAVLDSGAHFDDTTKTLTTSELDDAAYQPSVYAYNFVLDTRSVNVSKYETYGEATEHGEHVAGIIVAENNGNGMNGIALNGQFIPLKITNDELEPLTSSRADAISYAVALGVVNVINISSGFTTSNYTFSKYVSSESSNIKKLEAAVAYAEQKGVAIIGSAGNDNTDAANHFPSAYPYVIAVGATDQNHQRVSTSNYSNEQDALFVAAPGVDVLTIQSIDSDGFSDDNNYITYFQNTSAAAPIVTGTYALLLGLDPSLKPSELSDIVRSTSDTITVDTGTWKKINACQAVAHVLNVSSSYCSGGGDDTGGDDTGSVPVNHFESPVQGYGSDITFKDNYFWQADRDNEILYKFDKTGTVTDSWSYSGLGLSNIEAVEVVDSTLYMGGSRWLYKLTLDSTLELEDTVQIPENSNIDFSITSALSWDGYDLWGIDYTNSATAILAKLGSGGEGAYPNPEYDVDACAKALTWDGSALWCGGEDDASIHKIIDGVVTDSILLSEGGVEYGLAWDGEAFWAYEGFLQGNQLYKVEP